MLEYRSSRLGIRFEHPDPFVLIDPDVESDLSEQMLVVGLDRFGEVNCDYLGISKYIIRSCAKGSSEGLLWG